MSETEQEKNGQQIVMSSSEANKKSKQNAKSIKVNTKISSLTNVEEHKQEEEIIKYKEKFTLVPARIQRPLKTRKEKQTVKPKDKKYGICPYCGDQYAQSSLSLHIRRHTGEKPYKCDMCEKAFVELYDLKRHKRMHTGEKPHVCTICGKAFAQQNKLARHNLIHTGERPYKCQQCDRAFSQRNELNLHIRRHTGAKPYTCGICGESFITGTFLRNHQRNASHFEEDQQDRFIKIRVTNPSRSYRNMGKKRLQQPQ